MKNGKDECITAVLALKDCVSMASVCEYGLCRVWMSAQEVRIEANIPFHFLSWAERDSRFYPW